MSDIAKYLRTLVKNGPSGWIHMSGEDALKAAGEIEKLRAAMHDLAGHVWRGDWDKLKPETRAALGEKQ